MIRIQLLLLVILLFFCSTVCNSQVTAINCYRQNNRVLPNAINLIQNGSFENSNCGFYDMFCPNSGGYTCDIDYWICSGGGYYTYANIADTMYHSGRSIIVDGIKAVYFGNYFFEACDSNPSPNCLLDSQCIVLDLSPTHNVDTGYGDSTGLRLEQTVNGLIIGHTYVLEFWAGGEYMPPDYHQPGIFAIELNSERYNLRCPMTQADTGIGKRYVFTINANDTSETIRFISWGHIRATASTELVLDDVRLMDENTLNAISPFNHTLKITPNPFNIETSIESDYMISKIYLYDCNGILILEKNVNSKTLQLLKEELESGIYFYEIIGNDGEINSGKLIHQ